VEVLLGKTMKISGRGVGCKDESLFLNRLVREGLTEKATLNKDSKESKELRE
jgi:hypothetical protein